MSLLIAVLPKRIQDVLSKMPLHDLMEVVLDLGRLPEGRFFMDEGQGTRMSVLSDYPVTREEIDTLVGKVGYFTADNRAGIPRTLHRISAIRNRQETIVGLTCRVGKAVTGTIEPIRDLVESGRSVLMLGRPGVGKTTKLREVAKLLAESKRVVIVDTSNEIAGDGDIPHPAVGRARRMQVSSPERQKEVMIEAVENHTPEVIVVDEIGTEDEAMAARTIAERGVILVATAHGSTLENLIKNPVLSDLVGGIQSVTLGDDEAKRRATQKTVLEREKKPTFDIGIEIRDRNTLAVYPDVAEAVDHLLRGWTLFPEVRKIDQETGSMRVLSSQVQGLNEPGEPGGLLHTPMSLTPSVRDQQPLGVGQEEFRVFLYSLSKTFVDRILERLNLHHVRLSKTIHDAHAVLALRGSARPGAKILQLAADYEVPVFYAKANTMPQIQKTLREAMGLDELTTFQEFSQSEGASEETEQALKEVAQAVEDAVASGKPVELSPQRSYLRRLQHELVERHNLVSLSVGDEPNRRLRILPPGSKKS